MAKHFITLVLLFWLSIESSHMLNRFYVSSLPSNTQNRHRRDPTYLQNSTKIDFSADLMHLQHHYEHQREHQQHHREHYAHIQKPENRPRLWLLLQNSDEKIENNQKEDSPQDVPVPPTIDFSSKLADYMSYFKNKNILGKGFNENIKMIGNQLTELIDPKSANHDPKESNHDSKESNHDSKESIHYSTESNHDSKESIHYSAESNHDSKESNHDPTSRCPKCETSRQVEHVSEEELTSMRINFVKQQILEKLRLKERPNVSAVGLPKPIYEGTTIEIEDEQVKHKELDDYYARTSKKFIFLQRETRECERLGIYPSMCFSFKIDESDADGFDVNTAVLWIFKNKQNKTINRNDTLLDQQTIVISEVAEPLTPDYWPIEKTIAIQSVHEEDEWMQIDIEWPIKRWFGNHALSHLIHVSCQSCDTSSMDEMISVDKDYRPFIIINAQNRRGASRKRRGINCTNGVTECCREKLYISFDEIGWGDWIIQPRGYDAYFCRGSCGGIASVSQSASHHSSFLQKLSVATRQNVNRKPLELIPCCTAKQYSSLQLVFMDSNNTATQKTFPNMVVESCGCR